MLQYPLFQLFGSFVSMAIAGIVFLLVARSSKVTPRKKVLVMVLCGMVVFGSLANKCDVSEGEWEGFLADTAEASSDGRPQPTPVPLLDVFKAVVEEDISRGVENTGNLWSEIGESIEEAWKDVPNGISGEVYDAVERGISSSTYDPCFDAKVKKKPASCK